MGTNFYAINKPCKYCGRSDGNTHLGKSSFGWPFALQWNGGEFYKNWEEMKAWLKGKVIKDEYGKRISRKDFIEWVENRRDVPFPEPVPSSYGDITIDGYHFHDYEFS